MEKKVQVVANGTSLIKDDINTLGDSAALADDRVFAELFRLFPYTGTTVAKGIIPFTDTSSALAHDATVVSSGAADRGVIVSPFRAVIGSRTGVGTDSKANWRDIRTTIFLGSTTTLQLNQAFTANASGNPRWDLLVAVVIPDANASTEIRKVKDPTTHAIASTAVVTHLLTTVTLAVVEGTPGVTPTRPSITADSGGTYYIPLAYVRLPTGYTTISDLDILPCAPILTEHHKATGSNTIRPATGCNISNAPLITGLPAAGFKGLSEWGTSSANKPAHFLTPEMTGSQTLMMAIDLSSALAADWSIALSATIDNSKSWQNYLFHTIAWANTGDFAWKNGAVTASTIVPNFENVTDVSQNMFSGQSFIDDNHLGGNNGVVCRIPAARMSAMAGGTDVYLYVDYADGGALKVSVQGVPLVRLFLIVQAFGPMTNI
jgi:hypothetical protein